MQDNINHIRTTILWEVIQKVANIKRWKSAFEVKLVSMCKEQFFNQTKEEMAESISFAVQPYMDAINYFHAGAVSINVATMESKIIERGSAYYKVQESDNSIDIIIGSRGYQCE